MYTKLEESERAVPLHVVDPSKNENVVVAIH